MFDLFGTKRRAREEQARAEKQKRKVARNALMHEVSTSTGPIISGRRIVKHVGAVFANWHEQRPDEAPESCYLPKQWRDGCEIGDALTIETLVDISLRHKAKKLGANAIVRVRFRGFKNGCEATGDAVIVEDA